MQRQALYTIAPAYGFTDYLAKGLLAWSDTHDNPFFLANATIFLPSQRSIEALKDSFYKYAANHSCIMPNMRHLGDHVLDEIINEQYNPTPYNDDSSLKPYNIISNEHRHYLLYTLIRANGIFADYTMHQQYALAKDLAHVLDQAIIYDINLTNISQFIHGQLSHYWHYIVPFIEIIAHEWPNICRDYGLHERERYHHDSMDALCDYLRLEQPEHLYIVAGSTGSRPSTRRLMKAIMHLKNGYVVFPGLDIDMDEDEYHYLADTTHTHYPHAQKMMVQTLQSLSASLHDIVHWPYQDDNANAILERASFIRTLMCPPPLSDKWHNIDNHKHVSIRNSLQHITTIDADDELMEAHIISLIIRYYYDKNKKIALITGDRFLAQNVMQYLQYYNLHVNDSAGTPYPLTNEGQLAIDFLKFYGNPTIIYLRNFLESLYNIDNNFNPMIQAIPDVIKAIDITYSRQRYYIDCEYVFANNDAACIRYVADYIEKHYNELGTFDSHFTALIDFFTGITTKDGVSISMHSPVMRDIFAYYDILQPIMQEDDTAITALEFTMWLQQLLRQQSYIDPVSYDHNIFILGYLEARLQQADILILGGCNETIMPRTPKADGLLPKRLKQQLGFMSDEDIIGLQAHDLSVALAAKTVFLTRAQKNNGDITTKSRWLERLSALSDISQYDGSANAAIWYGYYHKALKIHDIPAFSRPFICVTNTNKPKKLGITRLENFMHYPIDFYIDTILKLSPHQSYIEGVQANILGSMTHDIAEYVIKAVHSKQAINNKILDNHIQKTWRYYAPPPSLVPLTYSYIYQKLLYMTQELIALYNKHPATIIYSEVEGCYKHASGITVTARADRIDIYDDEIRIIDYKTGVASAKKSPLQLPIEAYMLQHNLIDEISNLPANAANAIRLEFYKIGFGTLDVKPYNSNGRAKALLVQDVIDNADDELDRLLTDYIDDKYNFFDVSIVSPYSQHAHIIRKKEWGQDLLDIYDDEDDNA